MKRKKERKKKESHLLVMTRDEFPAISIRGERGKKVTFGWASHTQTENEGGKK